MKRAQVELSAGVFVLLGLLAIAYLAVTIGGTQIGQKTYPLEARFSDVTGLKVNSEVRLAGVSVGQVIEIELDPEKYIALVTFEVDEMVELSDDSIASVRTNGLLGDKYLSLSPGASDFILEPGGTIFDTEPAVNLEDIIGRIAFGGVEQ